MSDTTENTTIKKPFYKKWWFWIIALFIFFAYIGSTEDVDDTSSNANEETVATETSGDTSEIHIEDIVLSEDEYKASCNSVDYVDIARNPNTYKGAYAVFVGKVIQVQESGYDVVLRVSVTKGEYDVWTDTIYVNYSRGSDDEPRVLENDIITLYGELNGIKSYTTVMGSQVSIPHLKAKYIEFN